MTLCEIKFKEVDILLIKAFRDKQNDYRLKRRFIALHMLAQGAAIELILETLDIKRPTLEKWVSIYESLGLQSLNTFNYKRKEPKLTEEHVQELIEWVKKNSHQQ